MANIKENELVLRMSQELLGHGFQEHPDSPANLLLFTRESSQFPDVKRTYVIFSGLEDNTSAQDLQNQVNMAKDHIDSTFNFKGFFKSLKETYVLYHVCLFHKLDKALIDLLKKSSVSGVFQRIIPVLIEESTRQWFIADEKYTSIPYDIYKFHVQELIDLFGPVVYQDYLNLTGVKQIYADIRLASDEERKKIVLKKFKENHAFLYSICNLQTKRGEEIGQTFDIRHAMAVTYFRQALIDELSPVTDKSAFALGASLKGQEYAYFGFQDKRIEWLQQGKVNALAYCPTCGEIVVPVPARASKIDHNKKVCCPNSDKNERLQDLVFCMPDEVTDFKKALKEKHA
jgi:hypothetical protein